MLKVDKEKCNGDYLCVSVCPVGAPKEDEAGKIAIAVDLCMECCACLNICPQEAIYEETD